LANIYLHQLDSYWWNKYGNLNRKEKERRCIRHQGNGALIRYADDFLLLTNGSKAEAMRLKNEFKTFLEEELQVELSKEKTHITHVNEGVDFLGFHVQRYASAHDRKPGLFYSWTLLRPQKPGFLVYLWLLVANFSKKPGF
jgi:retron-type reverse transcriptase